MKKLVPFILFYLPRILTILFAIFISIFAFDVFKSGKSLFEILIDLIVHLIPSFLIIIILIISWKREWVGGLFYIMLSILIYNIILGKVFIFVTLFNYLWFTFSYRDIVLAKLS